MGEVEHDTEFNLYIATPSYLTEKTNFITDISDSYHSRIHVFTKTSRSVFLNISRRGAYYHNRQDRNFNSLEWHGGTPIDALHAHNTKRHLRHPQEE